MSRKRLRNASLENIPENNNPIGFAQVGGLQEHIKTLRRIIIFPLLYPDFYNVYNVKQPRGILFHGPPGTGKTLVAKALAEECNKMNPNEPTVQFILCNSADIFDKWVGSSEKKLRSIFEKAILNNPSIIFFDEIDALAPARSFSQDHVHTSVVATLLTLMNGLDSKPGIMVIGATNRLDSLDPALRRTGRFDIELEFKLPDNMSRKDILEIQVKSWPNKPSKHILERVADITCGYCGSDLQALCEEAAVRSLERNYPQLKKVTKRIPIDFNSVKIEEEDFLYAHKTVNPTAQRLGLSTNIRFSKELNLLSKTYLAQIIDRISKKWPHFFENNKSHRHCVKGSAGRLLITGSSDYEINQQIVPALIRHLEHLPLNNLNLSSMREMGYRISEEGLAGVQIIRQARRTLPSVLIAPKIDEWWELIDDNSVYTIRSQLEDLDGNLPILFIATASGKLPEDLAKYFENKQNGLVIHMEELKKDLSDVTLQHKLQKLTEKQGVTVKNEKTDEDAEEKTNEKETSLTKKLVSHSKKRRHDKIPIGANNDNYKFAKKSKVDDGKRRPITYNTRSKNSKKRN